MRFKTASWQFPLFAFAVLWTMQAVVSNPFIVGFGAGIILMSFIDCFEKHISKWKEEHQAETLKVFE